MAVDIFDEVPGTTTTEDYAFGDGDSFDVEYRAHSDAVAGGHTKWDSESIELQRSEVGAAITSTIPSVRLGLPLAGVVVEELPAAGWFAVKATYSFEQAQDAAGKQKQEDGDTRWSFEIGTTTQRIRLSEQLKAKQPAAAPGTIGQPGVIGWDGKKVNGVDILVPQSSWEETHILADIPLAWRTRWLRAIGKINSTSFAGAAPGEMLLVGISGGRQGYQNWEVSFKYQFSENRVNVPFEILNASGIRETVNIASLGGWDVVDFAYGEQIEGDNAVTLPIGIFVHQVYRTFDFNTLFDP